MHKGESASASTENGYQRRELGKDPIQMQNRESASASTENGHQCRELIIDITDDLEPALWPECCIYKVPKNLRNLKKKAYTPQLISIGPLHHGNPELADMEKQKSRYLKAFVDRTKIELKLFKTRVMDKEGRIRRCYSRPSKLSRDQYVNMILLDAVFIIELFLRHKEDQDDCILQKLWLKNGIHDDLILLENQLPYALLVDLYNSVFPENHQPNFHQLTFTYFLEYNPEKLIINDQTGVYHFTDLLRYFMSRRLERKSSWTSESIQTATKLHEAGVEFKGMEKASLSDIKFNKPVSCFCLGKPVLKLLQFEVNDTTECFFRNLMAWEQCHCPDETYICSYISLMDFLINTVDDVDLLIEKEVIIDYSGSSKAVANMVNKLCINIKASKYYFRDVKESLNKHCTKRRHRCMATLRGVYFSNFWRGTSTVAASFLLLLTLAQTIFSILQLT